MNTRDELADLGDEIDDYTTHKRAAELQEFEEQFTVQNIAGRRKIVSKVWDYIKDNPWTMAPITLFGVLLIFPIILRIALWWWTLILTGTGQ